ncbi:hypothetical protein E2C01_050498 [Portunus trituberculatus]|uniref:Uncharacterized protein n=1 Tax=Portunus trituberculatus TaxID=210409 RepID=A0A5B7GG50_PORTR|nr:hypothetical protein [Portunus trituberculatus]
MSQELKETRKKRGGGSTKDSAVSVFHQLAAFAALQAEVELLPENPDNLEADTDETDLFHKDTRKIRAQAAIFLKRANDILCDLCRLSLPVTAKYALLLMMHFPVFYLFSKSILEYLSTTVYMVAHQQSVALCFLLLSLR